MTSDADDFKILAPPQRSPIAAPKDAGPSERVRWCTQVTDRLNDEAEFIRNMAAALSHFHICIERTKTAAEKTNESITELRNQFPTFKPGRRHSDRQDDEATAQDVTDEIKRPTWSPWARKLYVLYRVPEIRFLVVIPLGLLLAWNILKLLPPEGREWLFRIVKLLV